ncbi:family 43 glycosylhydrolase [Arachidicoccus soli]|uniref:Carbohydrate-binding protein n=1 Tax=Arachidicoccus soli TaxID=2341117 RepID=A0A386HRG0_9BACT|nr:family 43 glycosylhydrolase [Arachidicoccus soli]AYD48021.1 carbohydrate-binding protein [Arachidicoccus soli]
MKSLVVLLALLLPLIGMSQNPIIQTIHTADPAVMVYRDTLFLYTGHDEDNSNWFSMKDWHVYSTIDMVNWTERGADLSLKNFSWASKDAWAGQCIYRNGKFYWYVPMNQANGQGMAIGVAISDKPTGPFVDALGKLLVTTHWGDIDPTVFIDDDGQAYLYWGNPNLYYIKLNKDMVSYDQKLGIVKVPLTDKGFKLRIINAKNTFGWAKSIHGLSAHCFKNNTDNKYYWYVSAIDKRTNKEVIGVAVGKEAIGPFVDMLGRPLITAHCAGGNINPTVVIDSSNQAFLTWGNSALYYVRLNENMQSYDESKGIQQLPLSKKNWFISQIKEAAKNTGKRFTTYEEGPWFYKRNRQYYLVYPAGGVPEHLAYSTSKSATGPWVYQDTIMPTIRQGGAFTNHPAVIDYKGNSYLFYHNANLPGGSGFDRSVCVEQFKYNTDGTIPRIKPTKAGIIKSVAYLNPYIRQESETIAWENGVESASDNKTGVYITDIDNNDYIKVRDVDFGKGAKQFQAIISSLKNNGKIEIRIDSLEGKLLTSCAVKNTGGLGNWATVTSKVAKTMGVHDVYFVFKGTGGHLFNFDWWKFSKG